MIITDNKNKSYETRDLSTLKFITSIFYFLILKQKTENKVGSVLLKS